MITGGSRRAVAATIVIPVMTVLTACGSSEPDRSTTPLTATAAGQGALDGELTVLAAASLTDAFTELAAAFEARNPGVTVVLSFGASSELATSVVAGLEADVIATASESTMATITDADLAVGEAAVFATNELEIAVPPGNPGQVRELADLADPELVVALCAPEVPCGAAAEELLGLAGVVVEPDTLEEDVRAALAKVVLGEVDAALVYRTDVLAAGEAVAGVEIPGAGAVVSRYPVVALADAPRPDAAAAFVAFIRSADAAAVLEAAGFGVP